MGFFTRDSSIRYYGSVLAPIRSFSVDRGIGQTRPDPFFVLSYLSYVAALLLCYTFKINVFYFIVYIYIYYIIYIYICMFAWFS